MKKLIIIALALQGCSDLPGGDIDFISKFCSNMGGTYSVRLGSGDDKFVCNYSEISDQHGGTVRAIYDLDDEIKLAAYRSQQ